MLSLKREAVRLGLHVRAAQRWARAGKIEGAVKINDHDWIVPPGALEAAIRARRPRLRRTTQKLLRRRGFGVKST